MDDHLAKGERTRRAIMHAAIGRFAAAGLRATSVAEIARDVGVSPAAVFVYFPNKQTLFNDAVDQDAEGLIHDALADLLQGTFDHDWAGLFVRLIEALPRHPLARRVLAGEEGKTADRLIDLPSVAQVRAGLASALRSGQDAGSVRADIDPETIAAGVEGIIMSVLITVTQTGGEPDPVRGIGVLAVLAAAVEPPK